MNDTSRQADAPLVWEPDDEADRFDPLSLAAAQWLARRHDPIATGYDPVAFNAWIEEDPRHRQAFERLRDLWEASGDVLTGSLSAPSAVPVPCARRSRVAVWALMTVMGAACLALVTVIGAACLTASPFGADHATAPGEIATVTLPDGSVAELSTDTALTLDYTASRRRVALLSGEAYFSVAPDPDLPFQVAADGVVSEALGTAFSVFRDAGRVTVTVTEHSVAVRVNDRRRVLKAGDTVSVIDARIGEIEQADPSRALTWRHGKLAFVEMPLGQVLRHTDRWRTGRTLLLDQDLARRPVTLVIDIDRLDELTAILARSVPIRSVEITPFLTLVYAVR